MDDREFTIFKNLPPEMQLKVWHHALPKPRTITITDTGYTTRDARGWIVRNYRVSHNAQNVPCILHACSDSRKVALKRYQLAFGSQLRQQPIYFNFQIDVLFFPREHAITSFFGGHLIFGASGFVGDVKEKVRHVTIGGSLGDGKIPEGLAALNSLETLTLEEPKVPHWSLHLVVEALENKWRARVEKNEAGREEAVMTTKHLASGGLVNGIPQIFWLSEFKLKQKSNREQEPRPKGAKKILPPAPYKRLRLRSDIWGPRYDEGIHRGLP